MAAKDSELWLKDSQALTPVLSEYTTAVSLAKEVKELVKSVESPSNSSYMLQNDLLTRNSDQRSFIPHSPTTIQNTEEIMAQYVRTPNDTNDPSYTQLKLPYSVVCRQRYMNAAKRHRAYFIKEIQTHELLAVKALDGVRIHREFCNPIISQVKQSELITLTKEQKEKLEKLLSTP